MFLSALGVEPRSAITPLSGGERQLRPELSDAARGHKGSPARVEGVMHKVTIGAITLCAVGLLSGCGGGDDAQLGGRMKLAVSDAPVDGATHVVVAFTGVERP